MTTLSPDLQEQLNHLIIHHKLDAVADEIRKNTAECFALVVDERDDYSRLGNTRLGGEPDLPVGVDWPFVEDNGERRFANFVAQINFAELPRSIDDQSLPESGILYLFVRYMESASEPVVMDSIFYDGDMATLARRESPAYDELCDEYLVDLIPQKIKAVPAISLASYRKNFQRYVEQHAGKVGGKDGESRRYELQSALHLEGQIAQLLGFANAGDERENLYRKLVLAKMGKRRLVNRDYWDSMDEYEAYIQQFNYDAKMVQFYERMREGVIWLTTNGAAIQQAVDEWRLLLRIDSNFAMNLNINDADPLYVFIRHEDLANRNFWNLVGEVTQG
jgi:uncharacterized protein YwqG